MKGKTALAGKLPEELAELLPSYPLFRTRQLYQAIYSGAGSFDEMSSLPVSMRKELEENFQLFPGSITNEFKDRDGTVKYVISLGDGIAVEAVLLCDEEDRKTACLSTQAGCPMKCVFCKTGTLGFRRNLSASEMAGQFLLLLQKEPKISNIVIMGMGEPLLNLEALKKSLNYFTHQNGLNISKRRITISTCGIEKGIQDLADNGPDIRLALSLTTARQDLRERLMPVSRENPLNKIKDSLLYYQKKKAERITLEMVLLSGINTSPAEAVAVAEFTKGLNTVINLIPWNPVEGLNLEGNTLKSPSHIEITAFAAALEYRKLKVTQRYGKGRSIGAACGQLGMTNYQGNRE